MGTSYYITTPSEIPTKELLAADKIVMFHIGKSSWGWEFQFKSWSKTDEIGINLHSWKQWKKLILHVGYVFTEYYTIMSASSFIELVEQSRRMYRNNFTNEIKQAINPYTYFSVHHKHLIREGIVYRDREGWTFDKNEFS